MPTTFILEWVSKLTPCTTDLILSFQISLHFISRVFTLLIVPPFYRIAETFSHLRICTSAIKLHAFLTSSTSLYTFRATV